MKKNSGHFPASLAAFTTLLLIFAGVPGASGQGTSFTYQGRLNDAGSAANSVYDFVFALYNNAQIGSQVGAAKTNNAVGVTNGLFTTTLDFGGAPWTGQPLWLQLLVATNGSGAYATLTPRQPVSPTPYAITASNLSGTISAGQLTGTLASGQLAGSYSGAVTLNNAANQFTGSHTGNGSGLTNLNATQLTAGKVPDARLSTNVPLLNASQTFTGVNAFTAPVSVIGLQNGGFGSPVVLMQNTSTNANASPALRLQTVGNTADGALSVSANGTGLIARFGNADSFVADITTNGTVEATGFSGNGSGLTSVNAATLGNSQITTGATGVVVNTNLTVNGSLTASNLPTVYYNQSASPPTPIIDAGQPPTQISLSCARPAPGYFLVSAYINTQSGSTQTASLSLDDTTGATPVVLYSISPISLGITSFNWVVPVTAAGSNQVLTLSLANDAGGFEFMLAAYSFTVTYVPTR